MKTRKAIVIHDTGRWVLKNGAQTIDARSFFEVLVEVENELQAGSDNPDRPQYRFFTYLSGFGMKWRLDLFIANQRPLIRPADHCPPGEKNHIRRIWKLKTLNLRSIYIPLESS